ncbi:MAG: PDZ domain-containing protein [Planctomycetota bacterium]|jgi:membrane-associated protease RseP (regulator of RpoE activity)|nr:PDZ domain-containing protein [Planctomycetota bacterium]
MSDNGRLERPSADYVAGDLSDDEAKAFAAALENDSELQEEVAFWDNMGPALREHGRPAITHGPGPDLAAVVRRRLAQSEQAQREPIRFPGYAFLGWAVAAAAGILLAISLVRAPSLEPTSDQLVAYGEDGSAMLLPRRFGAEIVPASFPAAQEAELPIDRPATTRGERPWLGVWFQPVELKGFAQDKGLRVVRVAMNGPAHKAGIRPGDILLSLNDCPLATRYCLNHAFSDMPEAATDTEITVQLHYWQASSATSREVDLTLGCCLE